MRKNQKGFSAIELIIILAVVVALGVVGYTVLSRSEKSETDDTSNTKNSTTNDTSGTSGLTFEAGLRLQPKDFGVKAGLPVADVSAIQLADKTWRIYAFAQEKGIVSATSKDGLKFSAESGSRLGDGAGMPRALKLSNGKIRLYFIDKGGIGSAISTDGVSFTKEAGMRISPPAGVSEISGISTPVKLADGKWHVYFSELPRPGEKIKPHHVYSAVSSDLLTWKNEKGVRVGGGTSANSAEHPDAVVNKDGDVVLYFFVNDTQDLVTATSTDGIKFGKAKPTGLKCNDPNLVQLSGSSYRIYCGDFDQKIGGIVKSALTDIPQ